jgi:hypothetical protein
MVTLSRDNIFQVVSTPVLRNHNINQSLEDEGRVNSLNVAYIEYILNQPLSTNIYRIQKQN